MTAFRVRLRQPTEPPALLLVLALLLLTLASRATAQDTCANKADPCDPNTNYFADNTIAIKHSTEIRDLTFTNTYVDFNVTISPDDEVRHRLVKCGCPTGTVVPGTTVFFTEPLNTFVLESPAHGLLDSLGLLDRVKYVGDTTFVYNPEILKRVEDGDAFEVALPSYNVVADDDQVAVSIISRFNLENYLKATVGKPYIVVGEVSEVTPLGRAEWMKVIGMLFGKGKEASEKFDDIESDYEEVKIQAAGASRRPSVFFNHPTSAIFSAEYDPARGADNYRWTQPGGDQYIATLLRDANADYRYGPDGNPSGVQLNLSTVEKDFKYTQVLLNTGRGLPLSSNRTVNEFLTEPIITGETGSIFEDFAPGLDAVKCLNLWSNQKRLSPNGQASDFFESTVFQPDILLADYIQALHPELDIKDELFYLYKLDPSGAPSSLKCPYVKLDGNPPSGKEYVDWKYLVPGRTRFQIDDIGGDKILPEIRSTLNVGNDSVELFYDQSDQKPDGDKDGTVVTLRASVDGGTGDDIDEGDVRAVLDKNLGVSVTSVSVKVIPSATDTDSGGLSGGAIAGIVIGSLAVFIIAAVLLIFVRKAKGPTATGAADFDPDEQS